MARSALAQVLPTAVWVFAAEVDDRSAGLLAETVLARRSPNVRCTIVPVGRRLAPQHWPAVFVPALWRLVRAAPDAIACGCGTA